MTEQCKSTLYGTRCVRRTTHPGGYCHDHRAQTRIPGRAAQEVVASYTADIALMTISQGGHRSLNYSDALTIAQLAFEAGHGITPEALAEALCAAMPHPGGGSLLVYEDALEAAQKVLGGA